VEEYLVTPESFSRRVLLAAAVAVAAFSPSLATAQSETAVIARALEISRLESRKQFSALYDLMHPDAQPLIPREVVIGWYNEFLSGSTRVEELTVTNVAFIDWTWQVTGVTYPGTAEVSFTQPIIRDGITTQMVDVVRLVPVAGDDYRWFFGRNSEFVNEQIAIHARPAGTGEATIKQLGVLPDLDMSRAEVINSAGIVAGNSSPFGNPGDRGFIYANGDIVAIDDLHGLYDWVNYPHDINESGLIVGGSAPFEGTFTPYVVSPTEYHPLPMHEGRNHAIAHGINDSGRIVGASFGFYFDGRPAVPSQAITWPTFDMLEVLTTDDTIWSEAQGINAREWIVGAVELAGVGSRQAAIWRGDLGWKQELLPPNPFVQGDTTAIAINQNNTIVGIARVNAQSPGGLPWIWRTGDMVLTPLTTAKSLSAQASASTERLVLFGVRMKSQS
jgi:uncharacterized membrane protein